MSANPICANLARSRRPELRIPACPEVTVPCPLDKLKFCQSVGRTHRHSFIFAAVSPLLCSAFRDRPCRSPRRALSFGWPSSTNDVRDDREVSDAHLAELGDSPDFVLQELLCGATSLWVHGAALLPDPPLWQVSGHSGQNATSRQVSVFCLTVIRRNTIWRYRRAPTEARKRAKPR
jgi:hypothetical protein